MLKGLQKKKLYNNVVFLAGLVALIVGFSYVLTPKFMANHNLANSRNGIFAKLEVEKDNTIDVIVTGDSESYTTVSPMELWNRYGYTSFAAGQAGAKLTESKEVLEKGFENQNPKVVMLETNSLYRVDDDDENYETELSNQIYSLIPVLKNHNCWKSPFHSMRGVNYKGFEISAKVAPVKNLEGYMEQTDQVEEISEKNIKILESIKQMCEENGAQLVLYSGPSPVNYNYAKHNALTQLAQKENLPYLDLNMKTAEMNINWNVDTRDAGDHLNAAGGVKTTDYIGQYLSEHYQLEDHRDSKIAKDWNKLWKEYNVQSEQAIEVISNHSGTMTAHK